MGHRTRELIVAAGVCAGLFVGLRAPVHRAFVLDPAMQRAVGKQDLDAIRQLALRGADVRMRVIAEGGTNVGPHPPNAPLWVAINNGDLELVRVLIRCGAEVREPGSYGDTPLMLAAALGNAAMVEALIAAGAPVNARTREGNTALIRTVEACSLMWESEHLETARVLLRHGADPHVTAPDFTPLALAEGKGADRLAALLRKTSCAGREECLVRIAAKGPLYAVRSRELAAVKRLVKQGVSFRVRDEFGTTVMHAVSDPGKEILPYLLKHARGLDRAFLNERTQEGNALSVAAHYNRWDSMKLLLAAGVDPKIPDISGRTPLHEAVLERKSELVAQLLEAGASIHVKDRDGRTPLACAREFGGGAMVTQLIQAGAR